MSTRRRMERRRRVLSRLAACGVLLALGALAASPGARTYATSLAQRAVRGAKGVFAAQDGGQAQEIATLPAMDVRALQLGVYDSGESAQREQKRLSDAGVPCVVWQSERMRVVCAAATEAAALESALTGGMETYAVEETLPEVRLRLTGKQEEIERTRALLSLPDALFSSLCGDGTVEDAVARAKEAAENAPAQENGELCEQLSQSLLSWCALMDAMRTAMPDDALRQYAALTMCTLGRELRAQLLL